MDSYWVTFLVIAVLFFISTIYFSKNKENEKSAIPLSLMVWVMFFALVAYIITNAVNGKFRK